MKYALITGAAGGLAGACVEELCKDENWTIFAADIMEQGLNDLRGRTNERVIPLVLDITSDESCEAAAKFIEEKAGKLDVVVNAAGIHTMSSLVEGNVTSTVERMLKINVLGMVRVNKAVFPLIKAAGGRIINFSSECGWEKPQPFNAPYAITKYAVEAYTMGLRRELNFLDIDVVKIQPGSFKTGMHNQATDGYQRILETTQYYIPVLTVLKPLMSTALAHPHDKKYLVETVMKAIYANNPKTNYKSKNTWYLAAIDPIPDKIIDFGYKALVNTGYKLMQKFGKKKEGGETADAEKQNG
ncbi:MAG: SDR family NAD(P)-dependent oxidoreductase [Clostridia bacterium]|nr:SDR family NAD(P)-dependent oxidoreductase [Clostridia bacterium]